MTTRKALHSKLQTSVHAIFGGSTDARKELADAGLIDGKFSVPAVRAEQEKLASQLAKLALSEAGENGVTEREFRLATKAVQGALSEAFLGASYSRVVGTALSSEKLEKLLFFC